MTLRQKAAVVLVCLSTLISVIAIGLFLYVEMMSFFGGEKFTAVIVLRWLRLALAVIFVGAAVAVVGVLVARPWGDENRVYQGKDPAE